jgi:predicted nucleotidyltransferase component of viral defense system
MKGHEDMIKRVLLRLNEISGRPFVLKGGTALMMCYGLDRRSEDIDLDTDAKRYMRDNRKLFEVVEGFAVEIDGSVRIAKDTETVQRVMLHYGDEKPLKIELSLRRAEIFENELSTINDIYVYTIDRLCQMKTVAYLQRDKLRDLYDLTFILDEKFDLLSDETKLMVQSAFEYKGLSQYDYLTRTQKDPLIDKDLLETRFLKVYEKVGLLTDSNTNAQRTSCLDERGDRASKDSIRQKSEAKRPAGKDIDTR